MHNRIPGPRVLLAGQLITLLAVSGGGYFRSTSRRFMFTDGLNLEVLRRMKGAGIKIGIGTDLIVDWFRHLPAPHAPGSAPPRLTPGR